MTSKKNIHNFSLQWPTIFLPSPFSYDYPSLSFSCVKYFNSLLSYSIILMALNYTYKVITPRPLQVWTDFSDICDYLDNGLFFRTSKNWVPVWLYLTMLSINKFMKFLITWPMTTFLKSIFLNCVHVKFEVLANRWHLSFLWVLIDLTNANWGIYIQE